MAGNLGLGELIRSTVHNYITENGISNFGVEEIADLFAQGSYAAVEDDDAFSSVVSKFIVAGTLSNKKMGAIVVRVGEKVADNEVYEASNIPATLILEPEDLSADECNILFGKALKSVGGKYLKNPLESIHRRAVRNVSEHSNFVNKDSDYILITP